MSRVLTESEREMMTILKDYEIALSPFIQTIWNEKGRDLNIEDTLAIARYCQVFPRIILKKLEESSKNLNSNY
jgi:hypothetical protein